MSSLMFAMNKRKVGRKRKAHHKKRSFSGLRRININPRKVRRMRLSSGGSGLGKFSPILSTVIPVGIGVVTGLAIPKFFTFDQTWKKIAVQVGIGIAVPIFARGIVGRKNAMLFGVGVLSAVIIQLADKLILSKQGKQVLNDSEMSAGNVEILSDDSGSFREEELNDPFNDEMEDETEMNDE